MRAIITTQTKQAEHDPTKLLEEIASRLSRTVTATPVRGAYTYKGDTEPTFEQATLFAGLGFSDIDLLRAVARKFGQETILIIHHTGNVSLHDTGQIFACSRDWEHLGRWQQVKDTGGLTAWTEIGNEIWIAK